MKNRFIFLPFSILFYVLSVLSIGLIPLIIINKNLSIFINLNNFIISIVFSVISFIFLMKFHKIKPTLFRFLLLFAMTYLALVIGTNLIHDFVLKRLLDMYENKGLGNTEECNKLWDLWTNDLSRNLMPFLGPVYSLISTLITFLIMFVKDIIKRRLSKWNC